MLRYIVIIPRPQLARPNCGSTFWTSSSSSRSAKYSSHLLNIIFWCELYHCLWNHCNFCWSKCNSFVRKCITYCAKIIWSCSNLIAVFFFIEVICTCIKAIIIRSSASLSQSSLATIICPLLSNINDTQPGVPTLPPPLVNAFLMLEAALFLLSVNASTIIAVPLGHILHM